MTEMERRIVWDGWFCSEVCAGYFAELSGFYRRRQTIVTLLTLVLSSGAVAAAIRPQESHEWIVAGLAILVAILSLYSFVTSSGQKATDAADMSFRWARLAHDYRALWMDQYSEAARAKLNDLEMRRDETSKSGAAFPNKQRRIRRWHEQVRQRTAYITAQAA